ncbi:MAG: hypothetical protein LBE48_05915 [Methanomassiliicoccaceae archaeon]|jgi:hypothetical protein|nr:hypothetical protein [Methanomassiliicoccaceae archaeon]
MKAAVVIAAAILLTATSFIAFAPFTEEQDPGCENTTKHVNLIFTSATVPVNQATLATWAGEDTTYLWYERTDTFSDISALGEKYILVGDAGQRDVPGGPERLGEMYKMAEIVKDLYKQDKNTTFTLYVTDYYLIVILIVFYENGIPEANFNVNLCEDGVGSYNTMRNFFSGGADDAAKTALLDNKIEEVNGIVEQCIQGDHTTEQYVGAENWTRSIALAAAKTNVTYWLQDPVQLKSGSNAIPDVIYDRFDFAENASLNALVEKLSCNETAFIEYREMMFGEEINNLFLPREDGKKPLVFTGAAFTGENKGFTLEAGEKSQFETAFNRIIEEYGDEYFFVYKGHPRWDTLNGYGNAWLDGYEAEFYDRVAYLDSLGSQGLINILPYAMPMDMVLMFYPELTLGGYSSSLYSVINQNTESEVKFFVTNTGHVLNLDPGLQVKYNDGDFMVNGKNPVFISPITIGYPGFEGP